MARISLTSTRLSQSGKKGILKPNADGYYTMPIGALNATNSMGHVYVAQGARQLFTDQYIMMHRLRNGNLYAEMGHPKRQKGWTDDDYIARLVEIEETRWAAHFKDIWLDDDFGRNNPEYGNPNMVGIIGEFRPAGAFKDTVQQCIDNPHQNLNFSIRGITDDWVEGGKVYRVLTQVWTFDVPTEQGIPAANKWSAPALESLMDEPVKLGNLSSLIEDNRRIATESGRQALIELVAIQKERMGRRVETLPLTPVPVWSNWGQRK